MARRRRARAAASVTLLVLLLASLAPGLRAQPESMDASVTRWFNAEAQSALDSLGNPIVSVTVAIPYRNLVFFRDANGFTARYHIRLVQRSDSRALTAQQWDGSVAVRSYDETRGQSTVRRTVSLRVGPPAQGSKGSGGNGGGRTIEIEALVDIEGTQRQGRRLLNVTLAEVERKGLSLGDLVLYVRRDPAGPAVAGHDSLRVHEVEGVPDPALFVRRQGSGFDLSTGPPWLLVAVYDLRETAAPDTQRLRIEIAARAGDPPRWVGGAPLPRARPTGRLLLRLPPQALAFGANEVRVTLDAPTAPRLNRAIAIQNYGLDVEDDPSWKANVDLVESLAEAGEMDALRHAPVPQRAQAWADFWLRRDPDPAEPGNPRLEVHFARVEYARRELADGFRDGALSDRGRVYVRYGPPESIETRGMLSASNATFELWHYYQAGLTFYFRDSDGLSHFRLVWSEQR